ncbi:glycosyl transferase group 1 [Candidatus Vecturithrix granuli]|uniref:Glycosyl transferase group 1 n=1 Tax=Vecturithrix granuli TaxID=1499967 RepID=A0A081BTS5_VECG1|nr:glycosyl transferase group 1 [Candidatus Vecturithrix granuli]
MKIGIEATSAVVSQKAGVGYYTYHLIRSMAQLCQTSHVYTLYLRHAISDVPRLFDVNTSTAACLFPKVLKFPYLWTQMRLPFELWHHLQDVYFFPASLIPLSYVPEKSVMTIHDVAFLFFPECFSSSLRRWLMLATEQGIQKARKIIAVSEATRQDLLAYYGIDPKKVVAIHHGVHEVFHPLEPHVIAPLQQKYRLERPYILCVGTLQRRKNIPRLIQAFYLLKQKYHLPHKLVLIGQKYVDLPEDEIFATIERLFLDEEVIWTGYVPAQDLPALMNGADIFVLPSLYEGFGMPLLEAMACGTPVACSNISSLPEVVGDAGILFDPYCVENIVDTLYQLLEDQALRSELRAKGLSRITSFSWNTCARKTLEVLEFVGHA